MVHVLLSFRHTDVNIYISTERFLDTSQFVLVTYSVYHYTVRLRGDPIALLYVTEYVPPPLFSAHIFNLFQAIPGELANCHMSIVLTSCHIPGINGSNRMSQPSVNNLTFDISSLSGCSSIYCPTVRSTNPRKILLLLTLNFVHEEYTQIAYGTVRIIPSLLPPFSVPSFG